MRLTILSLLLMVAGVLFVSEDMSDRRLEQAYQTNGEWAVVDAVDGTTTYIHESRKTHKATGVSYKADISYTTKSGQKVTAPQQNLPPIVVDQINKGEDVNVQYLANEPTTMRFPNHAYHSENRIAAWMVLILGMFLFYVSRKSKKKS